jgi:hypothetical protein
VRPETIELDPKVVPTYGALLGDTEAHRPRDPHVVPIKKKRRGREEPVELEPYVPPPPPEAADHGPDPDRTFGDW